MLFDFANSKSRIISILKDKTDIKEQDEVPAYDSALTYKNGIKAWVSALFLDIRKSAEYFNKNKADIVARVMRAYIQEIVSLIKECDKEHNLIRDIGIRGDCVYAIYTTPDKSDINYVLDVATHLYSFNLMFQKVLRNNSFPTFKIGIGLGANKDVVIKTGKPYSDVNEMVWVGKAVVDAAHLSSYGNNADLGYSTIVTNDCFYINLNNKNRNLFKKDVDYTGETIHYGEFWFVDEKEWIDKNV